MVTRDEVLHTFNVPDAWVLAPPDVNPKGPADDRVRYLRRPFGDTVHLPFSTTGTMPAGAERQDRLEGIRVARDSRPPNMVR